MAQSLAVRYRPETLEEVVSQKSVIKILNKQLQLDQLKHNYLFCGPSGTGKAQPLTSKVYTKDGYKLMGDVHAGDKILDGLGNETTVVDVFPQGVRDIYKLYLSDSTFIEVADNHLNSIWRNNTDKHEIEKLTLTTIELVKLLEDQKNGKYFARYPLFIDVPKVKAHLDTILPIDPYLLGCLIGDGSLSNKNLAFTSADDFIINTLNKILLRDFNLRLKHVRQNDYSISSKDSYKYHIKYDGKDFYSLMNLQSALKSDGYPSIDLKTLLKVCKGKAKVTLNKFPELATKIKLIECNDRKTTWVNKNPLKVLISEMGLNVTSDKKFIPKEYMYASYEDRLALLQGLLDTDGTIGKPIKSRFSGNMIGGDISFTSSSKLLIENVEYLCRSVGCVVSRYTSKQKFYTYRYKNKVERRPCKQSYTLRILKPSDIDLFRLPRKLEKVCEHKFEPRRKILKVEFDRKDLCQCIYVESPEHTYITDNLTVTHNTTTARAFAKLINEGVGDPIEIDGASNNGVENVRAIIKNAQERSIEGKYKIFIIDEAHMITTAGWNAFLKCIEEPPAFTIFMFCTTDSQKIPATIINRVMKFQLTKIETNLIVDRLKYICKCENVSYTDEAIEFIAKVADGGMRDAIASMEQCIDYGELNIDNVLTVLGSYSYSMFFNLVNYIIDGKDPEVLQTVEDVYNQGSDLKLFVEQFLNFCLDVAKYAIFNNCSMVKIPSSMEQDLKNATNFENASKYYMYLTDKLLDLKVILKNDTNIKDTVEVYFLKMSRCM